MTCSLCGWPMSGPRYRDTGFHLFHVFRCQGCGETVEQIRPAHEWQDNQQAMRGLDARDCDGINAQTGAAPTDHDYFNYGRGR